MEETELREQFFAEATNDPWAHMATRMYGDAWADGYEQALRDHGLADRPRHRDLFARAMEYLTEQRQKSEAQMVVAMAGLAKLTGGPKFGR